MAWLAMRTCAHANGVSRLRTDSSGRPASGRFGAGRRMQHQRWLFGKEG